MLLGENVHQITRSSLGEYTEHFHGFVLKSIVPVQNSSFYAETFLPDEVKWWRVLLEF